MSGGCAGLVVVQVSGVLYRIGLQGGPAPAKKAPLSCPTLLKLGKPRNIPLRKSPACPADQTFRAPCRPDTTPLRTSGSQLQAPDCHRTLYTADDGTCRVQLLNRPRLRDHMVDVSIITPTLNASRHLQSTIDAVQGQAGVSVEHLIVDDGSTDDTLAIARHNGIRVVKGRDSGLYDAMNVGATAASGRILNFLGGDDLLLPGAAALAVKRMTVADAVWAVGGLKWIDDEDRALGYIGPPPRWMTVGMYASLGWSSIHHQATFMSRRLFEALNGFDTTYRIAGDYEMHARALQCERFEPIPRALACFRRTGTNLSASAGAAAENERVINQFAPSARWQRTSCGWVLRLWLNGRHPRWMLGKILPEHAVTIARVGKRRD